MFGMGLTLTLPDFGLVARRPLPVLLGVGGVAWARFTTSFGFRVATSPDGVRLHSGLLTTTSQTVPPGQSTF